LGGIKITNTSSNVSLERASVQIVKLTQVVEEQNGKVMYRLHEPYPTWNPSNVCWSERNASLEQLGLAISPNESKCALVAFHGVNSPACGFSRLFNRHHSNLLPAMFNLTYQPIH